VPKAQLKITDLPIAASSGNVDMVRLILRNDYFNIENPDEGLVAQGKVQLEPAQLDQIWQSLGPAILKHSLDSGRLLVKQPVPVRVDGTFQPFRLRSDGQQPSIDIDLRTGEFCNGTTALALAIDETSKAPNQAGMPRLVLRYGGPGDEID
jgi:hypothetical protein